MDTKIEAQIVRLTTYIKRLLLSIPEGKFTFADDVKELTDKFYIEQYVDKNKNYITLKLVKK